MKRVPLTDGSGAWFDKDAAVMFDEDTYWDGHNLISKATGSQWDHEVLYYTKSGKWVKCSMSQYEHVPTGYTTITEEEAVAWLIAQDRMDDAGIAKLPEGVRLAIQNGIAAAEL